VRTLRSVAVLTCLAIIGAGSPASAVLCATDPVPAATLLIPFFEVGLDQCATPAQRLDTQFTVANASAHPVLAGVTIWSEWGVPVTGFQVYIPGESAQRVILGDFLCDGVLPQTGPAVSPHPAATDPPLLFPGCNNTDVPGGAPNYANPAAPPYFVQHLQEALTGKLSTLNAAYYGRDWGDDVARGYLTVDNIEACHLDFPTSPVYFPGGIASFNNDLVGDVMILDPANNFAHSESAVAIEASNLFFPPGYLTFYGRYFAVLALDAREPLPTTFASTFAAGGVYLNQTDQIVWRERALAQPNYDSPAYPSDMPLSKENVTWFDELSQPYLAFIPPVLPGEPLINLVDYFEVAHAYTTSDVPYPVDFGWQYSNLSNPQPAYFDAGQSWIVTRSWLAGRYETSRAAIPLDNSCVASTTWTPLGFSINPTGGLASDPPRSMLFWADFEDGIDFWSEVVGYAP